MLWTLLTCAALGFLAAGVVLGVLSAMVQGLLDGCAARRARRARRRLDALLTPLPVDDATRLAQIRAGNARYYASRAAQMEKPRVRVSPDVHRVHS